MSGSVGRLLEGIRSCETKSCVQVFGTKSCTFSGDVFVVCDLQSRNPTVAPLLFVNDMVLLALTEGDLLWVFAPDCGAAGMRVSIFEPECGVR